MDPIGDGLTKIRNAVRAKHQVVDIRASRMIEQILHVLRQEGFIRSYKAVGERAAGRAFRVYLRYSNKRPAMTQLIRVSKPGKREYRRAKTLPRVLSGLGLAVISTSKGVMTEREAFRQRMGGEVVCYVW